GDGYSDVVIGCPPYAYVYHGSSTGLSSTPNWTGSGVISYGSSVSTAGDVNGDGYSDVIIGAESATNGQWFEGRAYVYHGSSTGLSSTPNWTGESNQAYANYGHSVSTAGDVNRDGYSDVVIGAPNYDNGQTDEGRAYVYHGSSTGLSSTPNWTGESNQSSANYGHSVSTAGDVNGDGYSDVVIGAPNYDNGETNEGRAYVYHGSSTGLSSTPNWTGESNQAGANYGYSVSTAGDVNGDGYSDVIIGAPYYDNGQTNEGCAFVYHGSATGLSSTPNWTGESNQAGANYGHSVSTAGDVDGDGYSDVIIGAINYDNGSTDEGGVFVYHGNENLSKVVRLRQMRTNLSTLIVPPLLTHSQNSFGVSANLLSSYGRVIGRAQIEVKTINTPFNGLGLTESNWINLGTGGYQFSQIVSGLTNNTLYKWRLRVKYHPKYGKIIHSRWYYIAGNAPNEADFRTGILTGVEQEKDTDRRSGYGLRYRIVKGGVTFEVDGIKEGRIIIYNSLGAFVDQLNIKQDKEIIWAKSVPQGVYFARIEANDGEIDDTGAKFVIIR
ncbi:MAG: VCBS repeat-containing protein, partial [candidate division WOR-3 bacterium]